MTASFAAALGLCAALLLPCALADATPPAQAPGGSSHERSAEYRFAGQWLRFDRVSIDGIVVLRRCVKATCVAGDALKNPLSGSTRERSAPMSVPAPGARACTAHKGEIVVGLDRQGNELSFCSFRDGSLVNASALAR